MNDELTSKIINEVMKKLDGGANNAACAQGGQECACTVTEFVGTALGDTIGLVIPNLDSQVAEKFGFDKKYRAIGVIGDRTGAGPQLFAADEAVKGSKADILKIELPRDTKGGAGHGCLIIFGAEDVSDVRRAVEITLHELDRTFGDVYGNEGGHLEFQYTARASHALNMAFGAPLGEAFGITVGAPASIGVVLADTAVKAATVDVVGLSTPGNGGTSYSNEVILTFSGENGAVKQAIMAAREVGIKLLGALGAKPESTTKPYIV